MKMINFKTELGKEEVYSSTEFTNIEFKENHAIVTVMPFDDETKLYYATTIEEAKKIKEIL